MQIVTDRAADLSPAQLEKLGEIHYIPLILTLDGRSYRSGVDIQPEEFYKLLAATDGMPTTSQPSAGDFAELYRRVAAQDSDILSVHISSGLSGTVNAARLGAEMVPEANITIVDSKTLSGALGWQVEAAARAIQAGWPLEKILETVTQVGRATETLFTLPELKYLIHGGRISHLKGLLASVLNIKPLIGVDKESGKYAERGKARTFARALRHIGEVITQQVPAGSALRVQVMHANNPDGAAVLREQLDRLFECTWLPEAPIAPVLGAHTG
ncbi:MAG TPA: DegV family protein, partial [Chloroflexi bacterium]|nr:DegV family protein [Chloroflexota bacterium]